MATSPSCGVPCNSHAAGVHVGFERGLGTAFTLEGTEVDHITYASSDSGQTMLTSAQDGVFRSEQPSVLTQAHARIFIIAPCHTTTNADWGDSVPLH